MRCLLDTCTFIDWISDDYLSPDVKAILEDYDNTLYISSESIKEYIHLCQQGKLTMSKEYDTMVNDAFSVVETLGLVVKYVAKEHLQKLSELPVVEGHTDPSDRLIIAQAISEGLTLISSDLQFHKYRKLDKGLNLVENKRPCKKY